MTREESQEKLEHYYMVRDQAAMVLMGLYGKRKHTTSANTIFVLLEAIECVVFHIMPKKASLFTFEQKVKGIDKILAISNVQAIRDCFDEHFKDQLATIREGGLMIREGV